MTNTQPSFILSVAGHSGGYQAETSVMAPFTTGDGPAIREENGDSLIETHHLQSIQATVQVVAQSLPGCCAQRRHTALINEGDAQLCVTALSSALLADIDCQGTLPWHDPRRFVLHFCLQAWQGEGQWRSATLADLNLLPVSCHRVAAAIHFGETGTWTTARMAPMLVLEDLERGQCWFAQLEEGAMWHLEIAHWGDPQSGRLCILADNLSERFGGGRRVVLQPGERLLSSRAAVGCCEGGFDEAIGELTAYRRAFLRRLPPRALYPIVFNDYMNCLWGDPTAERLIPLIDAAAEAGAEYFCIDAGWFATTGTPWSDRIGDWKPSADRFGALGFSGILDRIRQRSMKPGVWMELESVNSRSEIYQKVPADWLLRRQGRPLGDDVRHFWDYGNPAVRAHFLDVIGELYDQGVRYIKNDYNDSVCGADNYTLDMAESVQLAMRGFAAFLDELGERYPELLMENCGSGAMRSDAGVLSHCHVQSVSDQEQYLLAPSILMGTLAQMLPEQASCWAFPYPVLFDQRERDRDAAFLSKLRADCASGEETIFNMVTALCCTPLLSGRIDLADDKNRALIREAVALYKDRRGFVSSARPVFPLGMRRIEHTTGFGCMGLLADNRLQLAVWRFLGEPDALSVPLARYGRPQSIRQLYPAQNFDVQCAIEGDAATIRIPAQGTARLFEVRLAP